MSTIAENTTTVRLFVEAVLNGGREEVARGLLAADYRDHGGFMGQVLTVDALAERLRAVRAVVGPGYSIEDTIADADKVVVRTRRLNGAPAGDRLWTGGIHIFRLAEGRITEHWALETPESLSIAAPNGDGRIW